MASIDKVGTGYRVRYRTPDGASRSKSFARKVDADKFLTEVEHSKYSGTYVDAAAGKVAFRAYAAEHVARQPWRPATIAAASTSLAHANAVWGDRALATIRPSDVQAFVSGLGLKPSTVATTYRHVRSVFRSAMRDGLIARDPCIGTKLPRATKGDVVPPTDEQVRALFEGAAPGFRAAILLGAAAGLRQAEAAALRVTDIDWLRRTIRVERQYSRAGTFEVTKTRKSTRTIPVASEVLDALSYLVKANGTGDGGLILHAQHGGPVQSVQWSKNMTTARIAASVLDMTYHDLRHHFASKLIAAGCSVKAVQSALGHENASTTLDTYGHLWPGDDDRIRAAIGGAWPVVSQACHDDAVKAV